MPPLAAQQSKSVRRNVYEFANAPRVIAPDATRAPVAGRTSGTITQFVSAWEQSVTTTNHQGLGDRDPAVARVAHDVIVKKHGGAIAVESDPESGTTFILRLPLTEQNVDSIAAA